MITNRRKNIFIVTASLICAASFTLAWHVYAVTHRQPDAQLRAMARIDLTQDINEQDAQAITAWLYAEAGIDHVLCNAANNVVVFTYYPALTDADYVARAFRSRSGYSGHRYKPAASELAIGCPVNMGKSSSWLAHLTQ